jgi:hypothetical protein
MPSCRMDLFEDETETDDPTLVGENCHIVAESDDGPRANPTMPIGQRNSYANLILLCRNHHKVIDAQEGGYTVEKLHQMKAAHESWVKDKLGLDAAKQKDDELYAGIIDEWERLAHIDGWLAWSSYVLGDGQPRMRLDLDKDLFALRKWLLNRVWPARYPDLERAFANFRVVLQDFQECFREHAEPRGHDSLATRKFYKIDEYNEELYRLLLKRYEFHVDVVDDLMLELTRAANLICDYVRQHLMHGYRLSEGRLVVQIGPTIELKVIEVVPQYSLEERAQEFPYGGLASFLVSRVARDRSFGEGQAP